MSADKFKDMLRSQTVQDIEDGYKNKEYSAGDKNYLLREKARVTLGDMIEREGIGGAAVQRLWDHALEGWDKIKEAATQDPESGVGNQLYHSMMAMIGIVEGLTAVTEAVGEVGGMKTEQMALSMGAPPGFARVLNSAVYWTTQIVPVRVAAKLAVKGGQKVAVATGVKGAAREAGMSPRMQKQVRAIRDIAEGLVDDGVVGAKETVSQSARAAGDVEVADALKLSDDLIKTAERTEARGADAVAQISAETFTEEIARVAKAVSEKDAREMLPDLMKKLGVSRSDLNAMREAAGGRQVMNAQTFYATLNALEHRGEELSKLAKAAISEAATDADRLRFAQHATQLFSGSIDRVKLTKEFQDMLMHWDPAKVAAGDISGALKTFAEDMASLSTRQMQRNILQNQDGYLRFGSGWWQDSKELFANFLLPVSWPAAFVSNSITVGTSIAERATGGSIPQAFYMAKGMMLATGDALRSGKLAFSISRNIGTIPGASGRVIRSPASTLIGLDEVFKQILARGYQYAEGMRIAELIGAANKGNFVNTFARNLPHQTAREAWEFAMKGTFNNDLGRLGTLIRSGAQTGPGYLWFKFMGSPINLAKFSWNRTPGLQLLSRQLYSDIAAGGARADNAMARLTLGSLQAAFVFELAKEGFITGPGPSSQELQASWRANNEPYSIKSPIGHIPYIGLEPLTHSIGFVAEMAEVIDQMDEVTAEKVALAATMAMMNSFAYRTAYRQMEAIMDVVQGMRRGERLTERDKAILLDPAISIVTGGPIVGRATRALDPVARDMRTLSDTVRARIPGWSKTVPALRDPIVGDPIIPPTTLGTNWLGYFTPAIPKIKPYETDPIKLEAGRLQVRVPTFPDAMGRGEIDDAWDPIDAKPGDPIPVRLSPAQRNRWMQIHGNIMRGNNTEENPGIEQQLFRSEEWTDPNTTDAWRRQMFSEYLQKSKRAAGRALLQEDSALAEQFANTKAESIIPMMPIGSEQRAGVPAAREEGISSYYDDRPEVVDNLLQWGVLAPDKPYEQPGPQILGVDILGRRQYAPHVEMELGSPKVRLHGEALDLYEKEQEGKK